MRRGTAFYVKRPHAVAAATGLSVSPIVPPTELSIDPPVEPACANAIVPVAKGAIIPDRNAIAAKEPLSFASVICTLSYTLLSVYSLTNITSMFYTGSRSARRHERPRLCSLKSYGPVGMSMFALRQ